MRKISFLVAVLVFLVSFSFPSFSQASLTGTAAQSTLSLSPATGSFNPNDTFTVSVLLNTNGQNIVVTAAFLIYDRNSFQAISVDTADSIFSMGVEKSIDATNGVIKITRGIPTPGVKTASGLVAKINFKAIYGTTPSADNINFIFTAGSSDQTAVIKDDGLGTNVLSGIYGAKYAVSGQSNPSPAPVYTPPSSNTDKIPPAKVTKLVFTPTENQTLITWTNPTDGDYKKTKILRKENSYPVSPTDGTVVFDDNKNSFTDSNLKPGTTYYYSVYTYDNNNNYSVAFQNTVTTKGASLQPVVPADPAALENGTLFKIESSPKVYVIIDKKKKWISTPEVFETLGYKWTAIAVTTDTVIKSIPDYEDNLIRAVGDFKVYLVVNGIRHHVPNPEIFLDYGFAWTDVKDVSAESVAQYQLARLIRESKQGKIYYLSSAGVKKWIPTAEIFESYGNKWNDIQVISKKEMDSYPVSNLMSYNNQIYLIQGKVKRLIPNETILKKYNTNLMLGANKKEWEWFKTGANVK